MNGIKALADRTVDMTGFGPVDAKVLTVQFEELTAAYREANQALKDMKGWGAGPRARRDELNTVRSKLATRISEVEFVMVRNGVAPGNLTQLKREAGLPVSALGRLGASAGNLR